MTGSSTAVNAGGGTLELVVAEDSAAPRIARLGRSGSGVTLPTGQPIVEIVTVDSGRSPVSSRLVGGAASRGLRLRSTTRSRTEGGIATTLHLVNGAGLEADVVLEIPDGIAAVRCTSTVRNAGTEVRVLRSVATLALRLPLGADELQLSSAVADWIGESRWSTVALRDRLVDLRPEAHDHCDWKGAVAVTSFGTWSTGRALPVGVLAPRSSGRGWAIAWQIEHNGGWRWEVGEGSGTVYLALSGPTDADHQWLLPLEPGDSFTTVPVVLALGQDLEEAIGGLTAVRRARRRPHPDLRSRPVVFNDYMNTLRGDPTTAGLMPLVEAAAEVGAEVFCVDAGWYDDDPDWWPGVGEWRPSAARFPDGGLEQVLKRIRELGMVPGLWLEPEVVGVRSPVADRLPREAFLQRAGQRVVEDRRYHLDLRHPAARAHLDEVVDRLVGLGVGYLKLDYNIDPGAGTDLGGTSPGVGLLEHGRAHLAWLDAVLDRHPGLILENCASGGMRADAAMLARMQLQSTSDQQSWEACPPIAASAPLLMAPEQAASWAYPQPAMTEEEIAFTLCTTLLGRGYLSGHLDRMMSMQRALVAQAVKAHSALRPAIGRALPFWPLGIDQWDSPWVSLGLHDEDELLLAVWKRNGAGASCDVPLPRLAGSDVVVDPVFPRDLPAWDTVWQRDAGVLGLTAPTRMPSARVFRLRRAV